MFVTPDDDLETAKMYAQWLFKGRKDGAIHIVTTHPTQDLYGHALYSTLKTMGGEEGNCYLTAPWFLETDWDPKICQLAWSRMMETIYNPPATVTQEFLNPDVYMSQSSLPSLEVPMYKSYINGSSSSRLNMLKEYLVSLGLHCLQDASSRSEVFKRLNGGVLLLQTILLGYYKDYIAHVSMELYKSGCCFHSIPEIAGARLRLFSRSDDTVHQDIQREVLTPGDNPLTVISIPIDRRQSFENAKKKGTKG